MAKKKATRKSNETANDSRQTQNQKAPETDKKPMELSRQYSMEDHESSEDKVQNLKSLNALLLKQTMEKRQQIESLVQAKDEMETELDQVSDENIGLKMELALVMDFVGSRFREMGVGVERLMMEKSDKENEIRVLKGETFELLGKVEIEKEQLRKVCEERDSIKNEFEMQFEETIQLNESVIRLEDEKSSFEIRIEDLISDNDRLLKEEEMKEELIKRVYKEKLDLMENERAMVVQIDALGKEKTNKESELERLTKEKNSVVKQLEMVNVQSFGKEKLIDQLSQEKIELQERVSSLEAKLVELIQNADELTHTVSVLQKDCNDLTMTKDRLSYKVGHLSDALAEVEVKREEADKALDKEKRHGEELKAEVTKSEKMIETTLEELEKNKIERESLFTAKNDLESEKAILEKELVELKKAMDALKTELESTGTDAKRSLVMLKTAASMLSQSENREDRFINEQQKQENGTESYAVELESIEKAFKNKEEIIEEMRKEAETMKKSTEEAHKKQSFWTLVSSVTTIFAAASFAYAARTR